jgi:hypothetical protein
MSDNTAEITKLCEMKSNKLQRNEKGISSALHLAEETHTTLVLLRSRAFQRIVLSKFL